MKLSIIIPAHNEEKRIARTLESYSTYFNKLKGLLEYEIVVVINNSKDRTEEIVRGFSQKEKRIRSLAFKRGGKGFAVIEGFKDALSRNNDLIGFVDADAATSPEEFYKLAASIDGFDGAIADRYIKGSKVYPPVTFRRIISGRTFNFLTRAIFLMPYRDTQCGAKLFTRKAVEQVLPSLTFSKWAFDIDLLYNLGKQGFRIKSVPTVWIDKEYSKINFIKAAPMMLLGIIRLRLINSFAHRFVKIYDFIVGRIK